MQADVFWVLAVATCVACWIYFLAGGGTGMSIRSMSTFQLPALLGETGTPGPWSPGYAFTMLSMWWSLGDRSHSDRGSGKNDGESAAG